jgi:phosphopantothenoylcysteine synthetase/decarboxylase
MVKVVAPMVKTLACGEVGTGALAHVADIVMAVRDAVS